MQKQSQSYAVISKKAVKNYSKVFLLLLALLIGFQQMNMASIFRSVHANAQENLLAIGTESIYEGDEATLIVSRSTEDAETIEFTLPEGIAIDVEKTEEFFADTTEFTFDEENNSVEVSYAEGTSDQSVELYISAEVAGSYKISATSTNEISSDLDLTVHEAPTEEQTIGDEQTGLEEEQTIGDEQTGLEEEQTIGDEQTGLEEEQTTDDERVVAEEEIITSEETEEDASHIDSETRSTTRADANEVSVSTWEEFRSALKDQTVTEINLANDITYVLGAYISLDNTYEVKRSLEINGNGYKLSLGDQYIRLGVPTDPADNLIHIHNATLENVGYVEAFVDAYTYDLGSRAWRYRFGDITVPDGDTRRVARAVMAEVTMYGTNNISTRGENFYVGSMIFEPGTVYFGTVTYENYSVIWFERSPGGGTTGEANVFDVGEGSTVRLSNTSAAAVSFPAVYANYGDMTIGENANFYASMAGNAVRFDLPGSTFTAKTGSVVNLTSMSTSGYATVLFNNSNGIFTVDPGASMYIVGATNVPVVDLTTPYTGNEFILNSPKQYDIRNRGTGYAINLNTGNSMSITNSDIDLWNMGVDVLGPSSASYSQVESLTAAGYPTSQTVTSSVSELQTDFRTDKYRRIAGMNTEPEVIFSEITDADLSVTVRVKIGTTPDDSGVDENGNMTFIDVFSSLNQSQVTLTFSDNSIIYTDLNTDEDGYVTYSFSEFLKAGTTLSASAVRGGWIGEDSTIVVKDVTPPEPAVLDGEVNNVQTTIKGIDGEPGATVTYTINGADATEGGTVLSTTINADGTWEIAVPSSGLAIGDELQIFLTDTEGNKNPTVDTNFHDATFKAATIVTVIEYQGALTLVAPGNISFGDNLEILPRDTMYPIVTKDSDLGVTDTRTTKLPWTLTAELVDELYNSDFSSTLSLIYVRGQNESALSTDAQVIIYEQTNTDNATYSISDSWYGESGDGLYVEAKAGQARVGEYTGTIKWTLADTPANEG